MPITNDLAKTGVTDAPTKIVVYHAYFGCDSGCCGHVVKRVDQRWTLDDRDGWYMDKEFSFSHPGYKDAYLSFAQELVADHLGVEHIADLDWDNCYIEEN